MPLPVQGSVWPPKPFGAAFDQFRVNAAWFEGNADELSTIYGAGSRAVGDERIVNGVLRRGGLRGLRDRWFNGQAVSVAGVTSSATRLHAPLATNIATLSADLIMSDPPRVRLEKDGNTAKGTAQDVIDLLVNSTESRIALRRAAEWCAGISGAALTWAWDANLNDGYPWLQAHAADTVIPTFTQGRLSSLAVVDTYPAKGDTYLRHIMSHDPGTVTHGMYLGNVDRLGKLYPFDGELVTEFAPHLVGLAASTAGVVQSGRSTLVIPTGTRLLTAAYWINKPTIIFRKDGVLTNIGRADTEGGAEPMLDSHDETWSSIMRDLKIGRGRMFAGKSILENMGPGRGAFFDDYSELFTPVDFLGSLDAGLGDALSAQQFDIRVQEHLDLAKAQVAEVLQFAGYSQSSYGENQASVAATATDTVDRAKKTERTRDAKNLLLELVLRNMTRAGLELVTALPGVVAPGPFDPKDLDVRFAEVSQIDPEKQARTIQYLKAADALSTELAVRELHPDFEQEDIDQEVKRILDAKQTVGQSPFDFGADTPTDLSNPGQNDAGANDQAGSPAPAGN